MEKISDTEFRLNVNVNSRGYGYFIHPDTDEFIEIQPERSLRSFHGDLVEVRVLKEEIKDKKQAEVTKWISREKTTWVGTVKKRQGSESAFLIADDRRMYVDFYIPAIEAQKVSNDYKVQVELVTWDPEKKNPEGKIIKIIGPKGEHEVEIQAILLEKGIIADFADGIVKEAKKEKETWSPIPGAEITKRKDIRGITTFTIDPKTAKDFDDALSFQRLEDGNFEIGVHIADVSHFVRPGSLLDKEARERAFSVYMVDRTVPMLPEILSNDICSLNPNEDRLSFSAIFKITPDAQVLDEWFGKTVIHSNKRFTYEEAQEVIDKEAGPFSDELLILNDLAKKFTKEKLENGAIKFTKEEFEFELDANNVPVAIKKKEHLDTHSLIEEFMLLANRHVAKFIYKNSDGNGLMYRVHDNPSPEKIEQLGVFLKAMGYELDVDDDNVIDSQDFNKLFKMIEGKPEEGIISIAAIRTMQKAVYSPQNKGHFGLAFEYYTHFTSPIRRYPDLIVHRILHKFLEKQNPLPSQSKAPHRPRREKRTAATSRTQRNRQSKSKKNVRKRNQKRKRHPKNQFPRPRAAARA